MFWNYRRYDASYFKIINVASANEIT